MIQAGEDAAGELVYNNVKNVVSTRLLEFSDAFNHLGDVFAKNKQTKEVISRNSTREIVGNLVSGVCSTCENASYCWSRNIMIHTMKPIKCYAVRKAAEK